jgi:hypothetical protein
MREATMRTNVQGEPLSPESIRMLEYLRGRAAALGRDEIRSRVRAATRELDAALASVTEDEARAHPIAEEWSIAQVVDHVAQTQIRAAAELRDLLEGRRPPAPPVYEALTSGAVAWLRWPEMLEDLRSANAALDGELARPEPAGAAADVTVRTVLLANRAMPDGRIEPETFIDELGWKPYALVQRLHLLDHRTQVRKLRAALCGERATARSRR